MNQARNNRKRKELISHRWTQYFKALDLVKEGKASPEYAKERWDKLEPLIKKQKPL
jgi:hypothetical protein